MTDVNKNPYEDFSTEVLDHQENDLRDRIKFFQLELDKIAEVRRTRTTKESSRTLEML